MRSEVQQLRDVLLFEADALAPDYAVTFSFNRHVTFGLAESTLRNLGAFLDRELLGPRWQSKPALRSRALLVPEDLDGDVHFHGVLHVHPVYRARFERLLEEKVDPRTGEKLKALPLWRVLHAPGSSCVRTYSSSGWGTYITKDVSERVLDHVVRL